MTVNIYKTRLILVLCDEQVMNIQERNSTMGMPNGRKILYTYIDWWEYVYNTGEYTKSLT